LDQSMSLRFFVSKNWFSLARERNDPLLRILLFFMNNLLGCQKRWLYYYKNSINSCQALSKN
jgi:hypothetical protein